MTLARLSYRALQFWKFLSSGPSGEQLALAQRCLTPALMDLFMRMQASEQAHSLEVLAGLMALGEVDADLTTAALLHDVGKSLYPLSIWERVWIVLLNTVAPRLTRRWGSQPPGAALPGWKRAFVVAEQHAQWGAQMAHRAGASALAVALIRRHQEKITHKPNGYEEELLVKLQSVDNIK